MYNAFGSKRDLFDRSLRRYDQLGGEAAERYLDGPATTRECIGAFLHFLVDMDVQQPVRRGCLAVNTAVELAGHDAEILAMIRRMQDHSVAELAARIDRGRRDGDVDPMLPCSCAIRTVGYGRGVRVGWAWARSTRNWWCPG